MVDVLRLLVVSEDPVSSAGVVSQLRLTPGLELAGSGSGDVAVVIGDKTDRRLVAAVERVRAAGTRRVVVVAAQLDPAGVFAAAAAGACAFVNRADAGPECLAAAVRSAAGGDGTLAPATLGQLMRHVRDRPRTDPGAAGEPDGMTAREVEVVRLLADGWDTAMIGRSLSYSERRVKQIIHELTVRLNLRNRTHAVAYAVRRGVV